MDFNLPYYILLFVSSLFFYSFSYILFVESSLFHYSVSSSIELISHRDNNDYLWLGTSYLKSVHFSFCRYAKDLRKIALSPNSQFLLLFTCIAITHIIKPQKTLSMNQYQIIVLSSKSILCLFCDTQVAPSEHFSLPSGAMLDFVNRRHCGNDGRQ